MFFLFALSCSFSHARNDFLRITLICMTLFLKCAQFRQTLLARILIGPPPLVPSFAPLSHMYARPGSLLYKKPSIRDKNMAFFGIFLGFELRVFNGVFCTGMHENAVNTLQIMLKW